MEVIFKCKISPNNYKAQWITVLYLINRTTFWYKYIPGKNPIKGDMEFWFVVFRLNTNKTSRNKMLLCHKY